MKIIKQTNNCNRNYGIDALRIVSMIMIIMLHVLRHGGILSATEYGSSKYFIAWFLEIAAYCSVNCYALISGYVGVHSKHRYSNIIYLWIQTIFYSVTISIVFKVFIPETVSFGSMMFSFFPFLSRQYWYFTCYVVLFFFIPILNAALEHMEKKGLQITLITIVGLLSIIQPVSNLLFGDVFVINEGFSPWWLMVLYLVGGYIRRYGLFDNVRTIVFPLFYFGCVLLTWISKTVIPLINADFINGLDNVLVSYTSIPILGAAIFLLLFFERISINKTWNTIIFRLSPLAFSVYLIHDNTLIKETLIRDKFIWVTKVPVYQMIAIIIAVVLGIYLLCSLIDLLRYHLFRIIRLKENLIYVENKVLKK